MNKSSKRSLRREATAGPASSTRALRAALDRRQGELVARNPRYRKALDILCRRAVTSVELREITGCQYGPALVHNLRAAGFDIEGEPVRHQAEDGLMVTIRRYFMSTAERRRTRALLARLA